MSEPKILRESKRQNHIAGLHQKATTILTGSFTFYWLLGAFNPTKFETKILIE